MTQKRIALLIIFTLFVLSLYTADALQAESVAPANRSIYIFGDSWAAQMSTTGEPIPFDQALVDREFDSFVTLHKHGVSGSTLAQWAADENGMFTTLATAISLDPNPNPIVFVTLGGNDLFAGSTVTEMATNLATILTALEAIRADLQVVQGGYDILNPNVAPQCMIFMQTLFGSSDPTVVNTALLTAYQSGVTVFSAFERSSSVNTFGTLQGTPGNPTLGEWSPVEYLSDCIHLNANGYNLYLNTLFDKALTPILCSDPLVTSSACPFLVYLPVMMTD